MLRGAGGGPNTKWVNIITIKTWSKLGTKCTCSKYDSKSRLMTILWCHVTAMNYFTTSEPL